MKTVILNVCKINNIIYRILLSGTGNRYCALCYFYRIKYVWIIEKSKKQKLLKLKVVNNSGRRCVCTNDIYYSCSLL